MIFDIIMENSLPQITEEFIVENKNHYPKVNSQKKKGGPYSNQQRDKRREEVYRLCFEYGYSARKISELMKINRNTINGDIQHWYDKTAKNWNGLSPEFLVIRNIERLELQRTRLVENLHRIKIQQEKPPIERMIFDVESKIIQTQLKVNTSIENVHKLAVKWLNTWMKRNDHEERYISYGDTMRVSGKTYEKICGLLKVE